MKRVERKISPAAFDRLQRVMLKAQVEGHGATECSAIALTSIGLGPTCWLPEPTETVFVVDPALDGEVYPFARPAE